MNEYRILIIVLVVLVSLFTACEDPTPIPKPRAFPKVEFPERAYEKFSEGYCPFTFEKPVYTVIQKDTTYFDEQPADECWFDIYYPMFDGKIHCSYYPLKEEGLEKLARDAFDLAGKHNIKANYIDELPINRPDGTSGIVFNIEGAVASPFQFYLTDEKEHFIRGALYFNTQARPDSLAPIYEFVKTDMMEFINTLEWTE